MIRRDRGVMTNNNLYWEEKLGNRKVPNFEQKSIRQQDVFQINNSNNVIIICYIIYTYKT